VPGNLDDGELLKRIHSDDEKFRMPREGPPLSSADRELTGT
jgi:hypothetical protein